MIIQSIPIFFHKKLLRRRPLATFFFHEVSNYQSYLLTITFRPIPKLWKAKFRWITKGRTLTKATNIANNWFYVSDAGNRILTISLVTSQELQLQDRHKSNNLRMTTLELPLSKRRCPYFISGQMRVRKMEQLTDDHTPSIGDRLPQLHRTDAGDC